MENTDKRVTSEDVKRIMEVNGMSQADLVRALNTTPVQVHRWVHNKQKMGVAWSKVISDKFLN